MPAKQLFKTTIVIWTDEDPAAMELETLASEAKEGSAYCSKQVSEAIAEPEKDPDWDGTTFFDEGGSEEDPAPAGEPFGLVNRDADGNEILVDSKGEPYGRLYIHPKAGPFVAAQDLQVGTGASLLMNGDSHGCTVIDIQRDSEERIKSITVQWDIQWRGNVAVPVDHGQRNIFTRRKDGRFREMGIGYAGGYQGYLLALGFRASELTRDR